MLRHGKPQKASDLTTARERFPRLAERVLALIVVRACGVRRNLSTLGST